ncbi:MAG: hypothetical protein IJC76_02810 [Lachnospiraceae bacterium]|nr:hypothetical protein [Lachnospiraceae bacterium]
MKLFKIGVLGAIIMVWIGSMTIRAEAATIKDSETGYRYTKDGDSTSVIPILEAIKEIEKYEATENVHYLRSTLADYLVGGYLYYPIPGARNTNVLGSNTATMVPQGICRMDNYILITAYDGIAKKDKRIYTSEIKKYEKENLYMNRGKRNSVIYILTVDGKYITTLVYDKACHMGGITYDGANVWIAEDENGVSAISKADILRATNIAISKGAKSIELKGINKVAISRLEKASYCTYFDNKLWVGTFWEKKEGDIYGYSISYLRGKPILTPSRHIKSPKKTQGMCFYKENNIVYLALAISHGRNNDSKILCYKLNTYYTTTTRKSDGSLQITRPKAYKTIYLPPMLEQISMNGVFMYSIFESGARPYIDGTDGDLTTDTPIGYYCIFDANKIFK